MAYRPFVDFVGLDDLRIALRKLAAGSQKHIQQHLKIVATDVASAVAGRVPVGPTGAAAASVRPRASAVGASIVAGGPKAPYYPWLDFGGTVGRGHKDHVADSGAIKRKGGFIKGGRYIFPTLVDMRDVIQNEAEQAVRDGLAELGWNG